MNIREPNVRHGKSEAYLITMTSSICYSTEVILAMGGKPKVLLTALSEENFGWKKQSGTMY